MVKRPEQKFWLQFVYVSVCMYVWGR